MGPVYKTKTNLQPSKHLPCEAPCSSAGVHRRHLASSQKRSADKNRGSKHVHLVHHDSDRPWPQNTTNTSQEWNTRSRKITYVPRVHPIVNSQPRTCSQNDTKRKKMSIHLSHDGLDRSKNPARRAILPGLRRRIRPDVQSERRQDSKRNMNLLHDKSDRTSALKPPLIVSQRPPSHHPHPRLQKEPNHSVPGINERGMDPADRLASGLTTAATPSTRVRLLALDIAVVSRLVTSPSGTSESYMYFRLPSQRQIPRPE
ncbi:hypothetical protein C8R47DRAFT_532455 [Mycena vitilis]|nr:hypothetical protein C8R47DRAFT_532455 [Mycena vitilis]